LWGSNNSLSLGIVCWVVGGIGLICLIWCHSDNYVWLLDSIFIPGTFDGLSGLISLFVNIYGSSDGVHYGATSIASLAVVGGYTVTCGVMALANSYRKFRAWRDHERQNADVK
jgi:hypothetical protein